MRGLKGKNVLITGAASGIGRATALRFAEEGAQVGILDLDLEGARETVAQIEAHGGKARAEQADIAIDVTGDHRHAGNDGLRNHVGTAFLVGADDHQVSFGKFSAYPPGRHFAEPVVAGIAAHFFFGLAGKGVGVCFSEMQDTELR